jgi:hypothetical protein
VSVLLARSAAFAGSAATAAAADLAAAVDTAAALAGSAAFAGSMPAMAAPAGFADATATEAVLAWGRSTCRDAVFTLRSSGLRALRLSPRQLALLTAETLTLAGLAGAAGVALATLAAAGSVASESLHVSTEGRGTLAVLLGLAVVTHNSR